MTNKERKILLENNLRNINVVVSALLGFKTEIEITETKDYRGQVCYVLKDKRNIKRQCGIMAHAFNEVYIESCSIYWNEAENSACFKMEFSYNHIDGGSNGANFCTLEVKNDLVKIF